MRVVVIMVAAADSGVDKLNWLAVFKESTAWEKMNGTHVLTTFAKLGVCTINYTRSWNTLAPTKSPRAPTTLVLTSTLSFGQT